MTTRARLEAILIPEEASKSIEQTEYESMCHS